MKRFICLSFSVLLLFFAVACQKTQEERTKYKISVEYFGEKSLSLDVSVEFYAPFSNYQEIVFNAYPNAFREGATITPLEKNEGYGSLEVIKATCNQTITEFCFGGSDKNLIKVKTDKTYDKGEKVEATLKCGLVLPTSNLRLSKTEKTINLGNFYPCLAVFDGEKYIECEYGKVGDPFVSSVSDYEIEITVPSTFVVASGISAVSCDVAEDKTRYVYEENCIRDVAFVLSENFSVESKKWGNKSINYYFYDDENAEKVLDTAILALEFFSKEFCEYPNDNFSIAKTPFNAGGMEYPTLVYLSDSLEYNDYIYALVHEIAHQWWYGIVGNNQLEQAYLDEGLAEYSTYVFFDEHKEFNIDADAVLDNARLLSSVCERAYLSLDSSYVPTIERNLKDFKGEYEYANLVYNKSLIMMKDIETSLGRDNTLAILKGYLQENKYLISSTESFKKAFVDVTPVINSYLSGNKRVVL